MQSEKSMKGEIKYRRRLVQHQVDRKISFAGEYDAEGIVRLLKQRMNDTIKDMSRLRSEGIVLSPCLEIGAERCQRSLVMENEMESRCGAVDLSFDMLKTCEHYAELFNEKKLPLRICCDATGLPFRSNSFPFIFCYQMLHHFSSPKPVINEIYRCLCPGGYFYLDEEPYRKILHLNLYKAEKHDAKARIKKNKFKTILDIFFAYNPCNEVKFNVIENDGISLKTWKDGLSIFEKIDVKLKSFLHIDANLSETRILPRNLIATLVGGYLKGKCKKSSTLKTSNPVGNDIEKCFICPDCKEKGIENSLDRGVSFYECPSCGNKYPIVDDVVFLFTTEKLKKFYPDVVRNTF